MKALLRADASLQIGTGQVMRCLALAERLAAQGAQVHFVCKGFPGNLAGHVAARGLSMSLLTTAADVPYAEWQNSESLLDADETIAACANLGPFDWLVVDCYSLAAPWEARMRRIASRIMVIDDLANRRHDSDLLLDQNLQRGSADRYDRLVPTDCQRLLGPRYALLRPEFGVERTGLRQRDGNVRRVLLFFSGTDPGNETLKALTAIRELGRGDIAVDVVVGSAYGHLASLQEALAALPQAKLHRQVDNMAELMARADLALGAAGAASWERCCLGLPAIIVSLAQNQEPGAEALAATNCAVYLGRSDAVTAQSILTAMRALLADPARVKAMARAAAERVDGRGAERVARALDTVSIVLRPAGPADIDHILLWRNAEETRRHSHDPSPIDAGAHAAWFEKALRADDTALLIGERAGQPVGVLRYDFNGSECTVSVYLVPGQHGRGYGPRLLREGHEWLRHHHAEVTRVRAEVRPENRDSARAFRQAGYRQGGELLIKHIDNT